MKADISMFESLGPIHRRSDISVFNAPRSALGEGVSAIDQMHAFLDKRAGEIEKLAGEVGAVLSANPAEQQKFFDRHPNLRAIIRGY